MMNDSLGVWMSTISNRKDIAWTIARHLVDTRFEDLTQEVVEVTKKSILDTLGVMVAASGLMPECRMLIDLITEAGGKEESTIVGFGNRVPAWMAAFANGALGHSLDYDDLYYEVPVHPSSPVVSASLAIAERLGHVSGKDLILAVALGNDLMCRLGSAIQWKYDWNTTTVFGTFAAAAAVGKLLTLDQNGMVSALGIALSESAGTQEMRYSLGNQLGSMRDGYPARGGVLSALMAKKGIIGPENSLEGRAGLFNVYFGGDYKREALTANLGKKFLGTDVGIKAWPTCGTSHVYIDATLKIVNEHDIQSRDIRTITLYTGDFAMLHCQPLEERLRPQASHDAKYSIPFSVAVAATRRRVTLSDLTLEGIKDPRVLEMTQKVNVKLDPGFNADKGEPPGMVEIATTTGSSYSKRLEVGYGHHLNPISNADLIQKFRDCVSFSVRPVSKDAVDGIIEMIMKLERTDNVGRIVQSLS